MALNLKRPTRPTSFPLERPKLGNVMVSAGDGYTVGLKSDGTCIAVGDNSYGQCNVSDWKDIVFICAAQTRPGFGRPFTIGLKSNGTCVATGYNDAGQCNVSGWRDIVTVGAGYSYSVALKSDGTCIGIGTNTNGWNAYDVSSWTNVIRLISDGGLSTVGLKADGSHYHCGWTLGDEGKFATDKNTVDVSSFIALQSDGTCRSDSYSAVNGWTDVARIVRAFAAAVAIKTDGTMLVGDTRSYNQEKYKVSDWTDIIFADMSVGHTVGVKADGTCVAVGDNSNGQCNVSDWNLYAYKKAIIISLAGLNLLDKSMVNGFTVDGVEPEKTKRRVAFKVDDKWNKLTVTSGTAALTPLTTQDITADSILEEGNTAAEISSVTSCPPMVGKLVYPAVALYADESATVMPTFGLTVKAAIDTTVNVYTYTDYSQEYSFGRDDVNLVSLVAETETKGGGKVDITARIKTAGTWSEYQPLNNCQMKQASAVQLKAVYSVQSTDGSDSAAIKSVTVKYSTSGATVADATTDIVTVTKRFSYDLSYIHAYIKHKQLIDAKINAYCAIRKRPAHRDMVQVGNGTGALTTYKLTDAGINQDTLMVYVDGKAINDYGYNTETSELTITADKDAVISASYEYGWELSTWKQMTQGETQINDSGEYTTEYVYNVPAHDGVYTVTAVKYSLERPTGHVEEETIGTGTGKRQLIKLPHIARKETIVCNGSWSYDYDRQLLTIIAPEKEPIVISYDWIAETPEVHAVGAGWADKGD